jgi:hypothetical protein
MVYVDEYKSRTGKNGNKKSAHLVADTLQELHDFAKKLGLMGFQTPDTHPHYDIMSKVRWERAFGMGATEVTTREILNKSKLLAKEETFEKLFSDYLAWALNQFSDDTISSVIKKMRKEVDEVDQEFHYFKGQDAVVKEIVDVTMLCLFTNSKLTRKLTFDGLKKAFREKLEENKGREWIKKEDGTYQHIKKQPTEQY